MADVDLARPVLASLLAAGFAAAFLHAALPTHWLPFVLVSRAQKWSAARMLAAVAAAGAAHVATTAVVGGLLVAAGLALDPLLGGVLPYLSGLLLLGFGAFYLARATMRRPLPAGGPAGAPGMDLAEPQVSNRAAFMGLVAMLAVSPGEVLLPIYLSAAEEGLTVLALLTLVFAAGTILGMTLLSLLARAGASILRLERWARYEGAVLGGALIVLGLLVLAHQH
ncbi:MAG: hypothetical protein EON88_32825 [Brevundimonas sp.]|nr:MAG: hypothetical protein EON88_32825 [Brevundimonas sp.]